MYIKLIEWTCHSYMHGLLIYYVLIGQVSLENNIISDAEFLQQILD
jgi:hypothetical protein